jgi:hypothetical protein
MVLGRVRVFEQQFEADLSADEKVDGTWLFPSFVDEFFERELLEFKAVDEGM